MSAASPYETLDMDRDIAQGNRPTTYLEQFLYGQSVLIYAGTPENNVEAPPATLCMDSTGSAGSILYIKKTGTGSTGWVNVNA